MKKSLEEDVMTIFLENLKENIINTLEGIKVRIEQDEKSFTGFLRDKDISNYKKEMANYLMTFMRDLEPAPIQEDEKDEVKSNASDVDQDKIFKDLVIKEILKIQTQTSQNSEKAGQQPGKFDKELSNLMALTEKIYQKFLECGLLNIPRDTDPFHMLCFYSGSYLSMKAEQSFEMSYLSYLSTHPNVSDLWKLALKKEKIIAEQIQECKNALDVLNEDHPNYLKHYNKRVMDFIDAIIRKNEEACAEHATEIGIPLVRFNLFSMLSASSSIHPKLGSLNDFMKKAKEEIHKIHFKSPESSEAYANKL